MTDRQTHDALRWSWRFLDSSNAQVGPDDLSEQVAIPDDFGSQSDAETWLGEVWRDLFALGVESVTLIRDGAVEYGPMSLRQAER